jgi:hypothetical protein
MKIMPAIIEITITGGSRNIDLRDSSETGSEISIPIMGKINVTAIIPINANIKNIIDGINWYKKTIEDIFGWAVASFQACRTRDEKLVFIVL